MSRPLTTRQIAIGAVGLALVALLGGAAAQHQARLAGAREILVASEAVDPRALLVGHYAVLALQPARIDTTKAFADRFQPGETAWLVLAPTGERGVRIEAIGDAPPRAAPAADRIVVKAKIARIDANAGFGGPVEGQPHTIVLDWGLDRIYLDQDEALAVEEATRRRPETAGPPRVYAILAVAPDGAALLRGVELDGRRIETSW